MVKKNDNVPIATTAVSSPLRGANQDYSGTGVKNDNGDYTISDEKKPRLSIIKKAVSEKVRDSWDDNSPEQRKRYVKNLLKLAVRHGATEMPHEKIKEETIDEVSIVGKMKIDNFSFSKKGKEHRAAKIAKDKAAYDPIEKKRAETAAIKAKNLATLKAVSAKKKAVQEEAIDEVSAMGSVRNTPVNIKTTGHSGTTGSPANARTMQSAADYRRIELDKQAQYAALKAKEDAEKQVKDREANQKRREAESKKAKTNQENPMKEDIELIEGRPKKNATSDDPGSEHIVMQLRKSISLRGQHPVRFVNGQTTKVSPQAAHKALQHHDNLKTSAEKDEFAKRLHHSPESMHDAMSGKPAPIKPKVSLAGKITGTQS